MKKCRFLPILMLIFSPSVCIGQSMGQEEKGNEKNQQEEKQKIDSLEKKVKELEEKLSALEKKSLENEINKEVETSEEETAQGTGKFVSGARALQAQNPEISVTGDIVGRLYINDNFRKKASNETEEEANEHIYSDSSGFDLRILELQFQSNLDPYSFFKTNLGVHGGHFHVCEAYVTWTGLIPRFNLTLGKFRQQFGVINRWHEHALDQVDSPKSLELFFGDEGLSQIGISMKILLPRLWAHANELTIEITNAENSSLFAGEFWSVPSILGHLKNYYDLSKSTYMEIGLSGLWGFNNKRGFSIFNEETQENETRNEPWRSTVVAGFDLNLSWVPPQMSKYRGFTWRTEGMYLWKETEEGIIKALSGFSYIDYRINQVFILGVRVDGGQKPVIGDDREFVQASPYLTIWPSEWVFLRLQYNYLWERGTKEPQHLVMLQVDFSAGPHKHDKY